AFGVAPLPTAGARSRRPLFLRDRTPQSTEEVMNYFTPELYIRGQSADPGTQVEVDRLWEQAVAAYERHLANVRPALSEGMRLCLDELPLHDAVVYSLARQGDRFLIVLRKDVPPRDLVLLTYTLAGDPHITTTALPPAVANHVMQFLY